MIDKPENPSAFPVSTIDGFTHEGMSLRDWFAGQALAYLADPDINETVEKTADYVYRVADAMLARRAE